jgi:1-acyl-sn-glycerol-3-phosphate acyltransferase
VADWPGIGWLARATGTVFIRRNPREAHEHVATFQRRLSLGHRLLFFPEGTSTDGRRILPFKTTLFAAFLDPDLRHTLAIQPVSVTYMPPEGADPRFYGWYAAMDFGSHLARVLAERRHGSVRLVYHPPIHVADIHDRKHLARAAEAAVRSGFAATPE